MLKVGGINIERSIIQYFFSRLETENSDKNLKRSDPKLFKSKIVGGMYIDFEEILGQNVNVEFFTVAP